MDDRSHGIGMLRYDRSRLRSMLGTILRGRWLMEEAAD
jgi:hypothetical protein